MKLVAVETLKTVLDQAAAGSVSKLFDITTYVRQFDAIKVVYIGQVCRPVGAATVYNNCFAAGAAFRDHESGDKDVIYTANFQDHIGSWQGERWIPQNTTNIFVEAITNVINDVFIQVTLEMYRL